jgi:hypothetical protein
MRNRLLTATALALPLFCAGELPAQTPGPGYAASISGSGSGSTTAAFNVIVFNSGWPTDYSLRIKSVQCGRTDAGTGSLKITLNDTASSVLIIPGSAGGDRPPLCFPSRYKLPPTRI